MEQRTFIVDDCTIRAPSKKKKYDFLVVQGGLYLPPIEQ